MSDSDFETGPTRNRASATRNSDEEPSSKKTPAPVFTSTTMTKSATPAIDAFIPTTMETLTSSSTSWSYPYPTPMSKSAASTTTDDNAREALNDNNTSSASPSSSELAKVKANLHTYRIHYRNMIIALTMFALLIVCFVGFKIWWFIQKRKKAAAVGAFKTGRRWWKSAQANRHAARDDIEISRPRAGPGGVDML